MLSVRSALHKSSGAIRLLEAHDRSSTKVIRERNNSKDCFEGIWISGLTQTTYLGIPDTEIVSPLYRAILQATNIKTLWPSDRPICAAFDADSGGPISDIPALVAVLVTIGVSMAVIEDKELKAPGKKVNSLLTANGSQSQADPADFCKTIQTFKASAQCADLMITARIESFNVRIVKDDPIEEAASIKASLEDALSRAEMYTKAGADAIMIHSKSSSPTEVLDFLKRFRERDQVTPLVVVPTTYATTPRKSLVDAGANVIIYANHLMRAKIHTMEEVVNWECIAPRICLPMTKKQRLASKLKTTVASCGFYLTEIAWMGRTGK
ncbi:phosphoenolpyruvate phosphomutase protein [Penicillium cosmopolitanum]|uniref:Phosphoenolpyruvate phosphomutase protein n=1 Tax=Penicillium cosmopolitanum TaxID=1131564 RepID=A0A9W9W177_9EURO|nr:phosphoenolpyruvate phosphomutase protein [Penicillium cosmopolitanum]KAJ5396779.1 phosphoenolpyruvate phosphomutase protein [Penicillium cosmopolitanum]